MTTPDTITLEHLGTAQLSAGDFIAWHQAGDMAFVTESTPGKRGQGFRLIHHDGSEAGYYTPTLSASIVRRGDKVNTPHGIGTVAGYIKNLRKLLVSVPGTNGAHAVNFSDAQLLR